MVTRWLAIAASIAVLVLDASAQPRTSRAAKDVTVFGFKPHYFEAGRGAPVVLHGLGGDGSRWAPNIDPLAKDFHVFAPDQIGLGDSDKPPANYHTGMLAEFLVGFLKAVGVQKAPLVGNSMGAGVALYTAAKFPQAVGRIVPADGGGYRPEAGRAAAAPTPEAGPSN